MYSFYTEKVVRTQEHRSKHPSMVTIARNKVAYGINRISATTMEIHCLFRLNSTMLSIKKSHRLVLQPGGQQLLQIRKRIRGPHTPTHAHTRLAEVYGISRIHLELWMHFTRLSMISMIPSAIAGAIHMVANDFFHLLAVSSAKRIGINDFHYCPVIVDAIGTAAHESNDSSAARGAM